MSGYKHNEMSQSGIDSKTYINIKNNENFSNYTKGDNIFAPIIRILSSVLSFLISRMLDLIKVILTFLGKILPDLIGTFNLILAHILFWLFLYTIGHLIMYGMLPSYDFLMGQKSKGGHNTATYKTESEEEEDNVFKLFYDYIANIINKVLSNIIGIFGFFEPTEYIKREDITEGRCDDIKNVTNNNYCTSNKKIQSLIWNLDNNSEDYKKIPIKMKNKETMRIPYKEDDSGFYIPDCENSYYEKTGDKTELLKSDKTNKMACKYVIEKNNIYMENKFRNTTIGSFR